MKAGPNFKAASRCITLMSTKHWIPRRCNLHVHLGDSLEDQALDSDRNPTSTLWKMVNLSLSQKTICFLEDMFEAQAMPESEVFPKVPTHEGPRLQSNAYHTQLPMDSEKRMMLSFKTSNFEGKMFAPCRNQA
jgi:hypothetical protein